MRSRLGLRMVGAFVLLVGWLALATAAGAGENFNLLTNPRFDDSTPNGPSLSPWQVVKGNGDKLKCAAVITRAAPAAHSAPCMFMFKGGPTPTILRQKVSTERLQEASVMLGCAHGALHPTIRVYSRKPTDLRQTVKVRYSYNNATFTVKLTERLLPMPDSWSHVGFNLVPLPDAPTLEKVVYELRHAGGGKIYVDSGSVELNVYPNIC